MCLKPNKGMIQMAAPDRQLPSKNNRKQRFHLKDKGEIRGAFVCKDGSKEDNLVLCFGTPST